MPIDPKAPIVPGVGAAGLTLGDDVEWTVAECAVFATPEEIVNEKIPSPSRLLDCSSMVDVWANERQITQISVRGEYEGQILGRVGIGSKLSDPQQRIGRVMADDEDNLVFADVRGLCFDYEPQPPPGPSDPNNCIEWIFVYRDSEAQRPTWELTWKPDG